METIEMKVRKACDEYFDHLRHGKMYDKIVEMTVTDEGIAMAYESLMNFINDEKERENFINNEIERQKLIRMESSATNL